VASAEGPEKALFSWWTFLGKPEAAHLKRRPPLAWAFCCAMQQKTWTLAEIRPIFGSHARLVCGGRLR
jgi:hypothetical protein